MTTTTDLVRLLSWLTPAMPTGAFAWSGGLEAAAAEGRVGPDGLGDWLEGLLRAGSTRQDAVLLAMALRGEEVSDMALALAASPERHAETEEQGDAFLRAAEAWLGKSPPRPCALPAAVGWAAREAGLDLRAVVTAYLHSQVAGALQAALRLMPLGQTGSVRIMARLEPVIAEAAEKVMEGDLGTSGFGAEIAALRHAALPAAMFRS